MNVLIFGRVVILTSLLGELPPTHSVGNINKYDPVHTPMRARGRRGSVSVGALFAESLRAILEAVRRKLGWSGAPSAAAASVAGLAVIMWLRML